MKEIRYNYKVKLWKMNKKYLKYVLRTKHACTLTCTCIYLHWILIIIFIVHIRKYLSSGINSVIMSQTSKIFQVLFFTHFVGKTLVLRASDCLSSRISYIYYQVSEHQLYKLPCISISCIYLHVSGIIIKA